jgi:AraC family transcriptional regulator
MHLIDLPPEHVLDTPQNWLRRSGVTDAPRLCVGPLPLTGASVVHWTRDHAPQNFQPVSPHPGQYHVVFTLAPVEVQMQHDSGTVWSGLVGANRFCICPPDALSQWRQLSACDAINVLIPVETIERLMLETPGEPGRALRMDAFTQDPCVSNMMLKLADAKVIAGPFAPQFCDGLVASLLSYLLNAYGRSTDTTTQSLLRGERLRRLLDHVRARLDDSLSVASLARQCEMSESHFSREFRSALGLSPHQYILKVRLEATADALLASDASVAAVAQAHGFASSSHFTRAFSEKFGSPPAAYRRARRG